MKCNDVRNRLQLFVLGGLPEGEQNRVQSHLDTCPECFARFAEYQCVVDEMVADYAETEPGQEFEEATRAAINSEIRKARSARWQSRPGLVAAVAAVLIAVLTWYVYSGPGAKRASTVDRLAGLAERWQQNGLLTTPHSAAPGYALRGSTIFALRERNDRTRVCAFDTDSGKELWQCDMPALGYLNVDAQHVYALSRAPDDGIDLLALDSSSGELLWRYHHEEAPLAPTLTRPLTTSNQTVCWAVNGTIHMLDASTGDTAWSRDVPCRGPLSTPAIKNDSLVVSGPENILCLNAGDGSERWQLSLPKQVHGQARPLLAITGSHAFLAQRRYVYGAELFSLNLKTREIEWQKSIDEAFHLLTADHTVCLRGRDVRAFDVDTGQVLWTRQADGCGPLTRSGSLVHYVDSGDPGRIVAVNAHTGAQGWQIAGVRSCDAFTRIGMTGFVKTRRGVLRALALNQPPRIQ